MLPGPRLMPGHTLVTVGVSVVRYVLALGGNAEDIAMGLPIAVQAHGVQVPN